MKPWMSDKDIADMYNGAVDREKQIKVLAELNACSQDDIKAVLARRGIEVPAPKVHKQKGVRKKYWSVSELVELLKLKESGHSNKALAEHFGRSEIAVRNVLVRMNPEAVSIPPKNIKKALELFNRAKGVSV